MWQVFGTEVVLYLSYDVFNVLPLFPPSLRKMSFDDFGSLDIPELDIFTGIRLSVIPVHAYSQLGKKLPPKTWNDFVVAWQVF